MKTFKYYAINFLNHSSEPLKAAMWSGVDLSLFSAFTKAPLINISSTMSFKPKRKINVMIETNLYRLSIVMFNKIKTMLNCQMQWRLSCFVFYIYVGLFFQQDSHDALVTWMSEDLLFISMKLLKTMKLNLPNSAAISKALLLLASTALTSASFLSKHSTIFS